MSTNIFIIFYTLTLSQLTYSQNKFVDSYAIFITSFRKYLEVDNPRVFVECGTCEAYASIPDNPREFTKNHLNILAHHKVGSGFIDGMSILAKRALELKTDANGTPILGPNEKPQFTHEAVVAAAALMQIRPDSMPLAEFIKAIDDVASKTVDIRYQNDVERIKVYNRSHPDKPLKFPEKGSSTVERKLSSALPIK